MYCSVRIFNLHSVFRICQEISIRDRLDEVGGEDQWRTQWGGNRAKAPKCQKNKFFNFIEINKFGPFSKNSGPNLPSFPIFRVPYPWPRELGSRLFGPAPFELAPPPRRGNPVTAYGGGQILGFSWRTPQRCRYRRETLHASNNFTSTKCWTISLKNWVIAI